MKKFLPLIFIFFVLKLNAQEIALLKYGGGGDWYANPTSLPNLIKYCNQNIKTTLKSKPVTVTPSSSEIFLYPYVHLTGHGNVVFTENDIQNLRSYLLGGGFLHVDDNYGLDKYIRREIKKLFPQNALVEIPATHAIFQKPNSFPRGLPKIHEHDGKPPQAFGVYVDGRMVLLYTYETDLGDGWEDAEVNNDPAELREKALKMGANIIYYIFNY